MQTCHLLFCPQSFLRVRAVTGLVHMALGFLDNGEEGAHQPSQLGPWGSCYEHTQEPTLSAIFTYSSTKSAGKTHPLQGVIQMTRSQLLASLFSALHTLPTTVRFKKPNQERDGVWDLAPTILEGARSSQKLLPPRGLHFDCSLNDSFLRTPGEAGGQLPTLGRGPPAPRALVPCTTMPLTTRHSHSTLPTGLHAPVYALLSAWVHLPSLTFRSQLTHQLLQNGATPSPPHRRLCPLCHSQNIVPNLSVCIPVLTVGLLKVSMCDLHLRSFRV